MQNITPIATSVILGATLALSGCKDKSEAGLDAGKSVSTPYGKFKPGGKLGDLKAPSAVKRSSDEASAALSALNLDESGSGSLTWAVREGSDGNYTFKGLAVDIDEDDAVMTIDTLSFTGLGSDAGVTTFSSVTASGIKLASEDDGEMTVGNFTVVEPSPAFAAALSAVISGDEDADELFEGSDLAFAAMSMDDLNFKLDEGDGQIAMGLNGVRVGKTDAGKMESFALRGFSVDGNPDGETIKMNLDSVDVVGLNYGIYTKAFDSMGGSPTGLAQLMTQANPYEQPVHTFDLRGLTGDASGVTWNMDSAVVRTAEKGGKTVVTQITSPLTIAPSGDGSAGQELRQALSTIGYESITISTRGVTEIDEAADRILVEDASITMEDGFVLDMEYDISGLGKMYAAQAKYAAMAEAGEEFNYAEAQSAGMEDLKIGKFGMTFNDNSFTNRVFEAVAAERGTDASVLKAQITGLMAMGSMMATDEAQQKLVADASSAIQTFLDNPGTLKLGLYPDTPLGMETIEAMGGGVIDVESMGIVIEAK